MSFHNRVLLNRLAVDGFETVHVMLISRPGRFQDVLARATTLGGHIRRAEADVDYIRAEIPIDRLVDLATGRDVEAYHLASRASPGWYPSAHTRSRAEIERNGEVVPVARPIAERRADLPRLSPEDARAVGYTANEEAGVGRWYAEHPTFDGRGITIAFLETALVEFGHPALQAAKTIDGAEIPKIAGILNTIDPDEPDATRVDLNVHIRATHTWQQVDHRTYILPRPGVYRFGIFAVPVATELIQRFAVVRDEESGTVWVDSDADADFQDEQPLIDANTRIEVRYLRVVHPRPADLAFVFTPGRRPHQVHLYPARSGHHTMSLSVATASATEGGLATGVAPGARALVVRFTAATPQFHAVVEGYLETARRSDVDILCDSTGMETVPNTAHEFTSVFFRRLVANYGKPIFHSAGNHAQVLNAASAAGDAFTVGGSLGPATFASLYGRGPLTRIIVHPSSAAGPTIDGAIKPDFLAPEHRISAGVWIEDGYVPLPKNGPTKYLPRGYEISCCTSASSPYAAGVAALLLSAARQTRIPYSVDTLGRALKVGAQFLSDWPAYKQGHGVIDVQAAWRELLRVDEVPRIVATTVTAHTLTPYAARGAQGVGIFEQDGWVAGTPGRRTLQFRRESGSSQSVRYRISWTGNDGTFSTASSITLPLGTTVALEVTIDPRTPGAHSALLNLHGPRTDAMVFRMQATILAAEPVDTRSGVASFAGQVPLMHGRELFMRLPEGVGAMSIDVAVHEGALSATLLPPDGLYRSYFDHVQPVTSRTFTPGRYSFLWPSPPAGTWSVNLQNRSALRESDPELVFTTTATYSLTIRLLGASVQAQETDTGDVEAIFKNRFSAIREPSLEVSRAKVRSVEASTLKTGLPNLFEIDVPTGASSLRFNLRAISSREGTLELYLYDCTSGKCFLWDSTLPALPEHSMVVRAPRPGRWVAGVNAAPSPTNEIRFSLDEVIAIGGNVAAAIVPPKAAGESWTERLGLDRTRLTGSDGEDRVLLELFDAAAARDALTHPWENRKGLVTLADRPAAIATALLRIK